VASLPRKSITVLLSAGLAVGLYFSGIGRAVAPSDPVPLASCTVPDAPHAFIEAGLDAKQQAIATYVARRFLIAAEATERVVGTAYRAAYEVGLDPLLVLAVIAIESRFNPFAQSVMGAKGLMQIIPRFHLARLEEHGGEPAVLDPEANILVGAQILKEYVQLGGTLEAGLQKYNGSTDPNSQYAQKVMNERDRFAAVLRSNKGAQNEKMSVNRVDAAVAASAADRPPGG
jgi:soluble lytic murein transglycosylase-like protein